jgi:SpoIIAA-like
MRRNDFRFRRRGDGGTVPAFRTLNQPSMPIELHRESADTYRLDISGVLLRSEYRQREAELQTELGRVGSVKLLCIVSAFEGWEPNVDWSDLAFYVKYGDAIRKIAIVGPERWRSEMLMFAAADLRKAPVEFFPEAEFIRARAWLSA